ncbi:GntR family transcriptional regulator [Pseudohaliea sp.]|uniref:GntR family transcriptional regulator n=1 Tax=Pseudohaliea sp. TaxID=2740289 RepID=UPI0032EB4BE2
MAKKGLTLLDTSESSDRLDIRAYEEIKSRIIRNDLKAGERLTEAWLAEELGLSKAPIRTALTRLCHENLMQSERRVGYQVRGFSIVDVREVFLLRELIEPEVARLAAGRLSDAEIDELKSLCELDYQPTDSISQADFLSVNRAFHVRLAECTRNSRLISLTARLLEESERFLHFALSSRPLGTRFQQEHLELLSVLIMGDAEKAGRMVKEQVHGGMEAIITAMLLPEKDQNQ